MDVKGHLGSVSFDGAVVRIRKTARGEQVVPLAAVSGVSIERAGIGMRAMRISVAGGTFAGGVKAFGTHKDLAKDPFAVTFRKKSEDKFQALQSEILAARASVS